MGMFTNLLARFFAPACLPSALPTPNPTAARVARLTAEARDVRATIEDQTRRLRELNEWFEGYKARRNG